MAVNCLRVKRCVALPDLHRWLCLFARQPSGKSKTFMYLRNTLTNLARKKNPSFVLHPFADGRIILSDLTDRFIALLRGCKSLFYGRKPGLFLSAGTVIRGWGKMNYGKGVQIGPHVQIN